MTRNEAKAEADRLNAMMETTVWRAKEHDFGWGVWDGKSAMILNCVAVWTKGEEAGDWVADLPFSEPPEIKIRRVA